MSDAGLPELIRQMLSPTFYPEPVEHVALVQTHISYLLLAGDRVYKVKKPVDLGFLDFSTLERRRHFCGEELRLNRRASPGLYIKVLAITRSENGTFRFSDDGIPVEYAVQMWRFPDQALLSEKVKGGTLDEKKIAELARVVAAFHTAAPPAPAGFGMPAAVRSSIDDNFRHTQRFVGMGGPQYSEQMSQTREFIDRFFATKHALVAARVSHGRIRECHGDLHLGNICEWASAGGLLLFDCIEFNEAFRCVDVMYDIGFVAMDLHANGRADLANAFVNSYAENSGDWEGLRVLPLYLCRQAYVRGKVNSMIGSDPTIEAEQRQRAFEQARDYFRLAWELTRRRTARLLMMCGFSGSGKSSVARLLARRLDAIHVRSDAVRKHAAGVAVDERGDGGTYSPEMTQQTYERLTRIGLDLADDGGPVILDGTYLQGRDRAAVFRGARDRGIPVQIVHCVAPIDVLQERIARRTNDISDATAEVLQTQLQTFSPFSDEERDCLITVDTTRSLVEQIKSIGESDRLG